MLKPILAFSLALLTSFGAVAQKKPDFVQFINSNHKWVDSVFNSLTPKERIGQLFLVRAHTNLGQKFVDSVGTIVKNEQLGGLVVFQGGPIRHLEMINNYQKVSKVPLLVTIDGEWGLGMRLPDSTQSFPYQMTLGALQDNSLLYDMGRDMAKDFLRLGIHFNFAPTVDINNNPKNPVIGFRSFGDNKENVTVKSAAYMKGMIDGGVLASIKHFPGHGDTDVDSHYDLPKLPFTKERLEELEMHPFRELIKQGATAVMVGHMDIPALDNTPNLPSSISKKVVTDLLRKQLGFQGLTVTDAMNMKGVTKFFPNGEADILAIEAGHDLLELSENSARAIALVEKSIQSGRLKQADIDARVKRILAAKLWLGLDKYAPARVNNTFDEINRPETKTLIQRMADASVTLLKSNRRIQSFDAKKETVVVSVGISKAQDFESGLAARLANVKNIYVSGKETAAQLEDLIKEIRSIEQIILAIHDDRSRPRPTLDLSDAVKSFVEKIAGRRTITVMLTNPYALTSVNIDRSASVIVGYQNEAFMQKAALKVILKDIKAKGKLPVTINKTYAFGKGL